MTTPAHPSLGAFFGSEHGAVTTDWVVLSAAIVGLGIGAAAAVRTGTADMGNDVSGSLSGASVAALGCLGATAQGAGCGAPTYGALVSQSAWTTYCRGMMRCQYWQRSYEMSDGTIWTMTEERVQGSTQSTITWRNDANEIVDAPEPG